MMVVMNGRIIHGDSRTEIAKLPAESVDCVITSPPYWGLRDYGVDGQLGLEPTFDEYVKNLCDIFDDVKKALKPTGTCFVNLGDTYAGSGKGAGYFGPKKESFTFTKKPKQNTTIDDKSLCLVPHRFAIEMLNRGWILRNIIIWHKPNCMPSSVKDRFTVDFETIFFFVKSKRYYFKQQFEPYLTGKTPPSNPHGRNKRCVWSINTKPFSETHFAVYPPNLVEPILEAGCPKKGIVLDPFAGAFTTALVAEKLNRRWIGIELNADYIDIGKKRLAQLRWDGA
jgi:site-specific DNA-methyltransferase (adenine-specific)